MLSEKDNEIDSDTNKKSVCAIDQKTTSDEENKIKSGDEVVFKTMKCNHAKENEGKNIKDESDQEDTEIVKQGE